MPSTHLVASIHALALQTADQLGEILGTGLDVQNDTSFVEHLESFTDFGRMLGVTIDVAFTLLLAATIAFHPSRHGRANTVEEVDYPKTVLLYAVVGTLVAEIVVVSPAMALVVFGIGGLLRFRTDVGAAHETGHVILATLVGIACGLGRYPLAVLGTAVGWALIWMLERGAIYRLVVDQIERRSIEDSIELYQDLLRREGWRIRGVKRNPGKERFVLYVQRRKEPSNEPVEDRLPDAPEELKGKPYWEEM